jgi:hypothetical protein
MAAALYYFPDGSKMVMTMASMVCIYNTGTWNLFYSLSSDDDIVHVRQRIQRQQQVPE